MSSFVRTTTLVCLLLAAVACHTTTQFVPTNTAPRPMHARAPQTVQVISSGAPDRPFVEVGIIESQQSSRYSVDEMSDIIASMRSKAARIGCDALLIQGQNDTEAGTSRGLFKGTTDTHTLKGYRGLCLMYE